MAATVRLMELEEVALMINYFHRASPAFLKGMGAIPDRLPSVEDWKQLLAMDFERPLEDREFCYVAWVNEGKVIGHSNINKIKFGQEAFMHLHLWEHRKRKKGLGKQFLERSIPFYFDLFELEVLYCEPYVLNPAPNKTLPKVGFTFVKQYDTIPGWINFHQTVNRYALTKAKYLELQS